MKTVREISALTGVSVRTLHYYDEKGLLAPAGRTPAGYRLYDESAPERLALILRYKSLGCSLEQIRELLDCPGRLPAVLAERKAALRAELRRLQAALALLEEMEKEK